MLSVILLSYNSGERITLAYQKLCELFNDNKIPFELIIVDDGSKDNSFEIASGLALETNNVIALKLSKNYTSHYAAFAGLTVANGNCATLIPDDEQQPYSTLLSMYSLWEKGDKIILPYRESRNDRWHQTMLSRLFYIGMNRLSDIDLPKFGIDTWFIDRSIVDILNTKISPRATTTFTEIIRLGFSPTYMPFERPIGLNEGKSRWSFKKKLKLASDIFYSSSTAPIRAIMWTGITSSSLSLVMGCYYLLIYIFGFSRAPLGWTTLVLLLIFFSGLILLSLGIIARYIHLIFVEAKGRPGYVISQLIKSE